MSKIDPKDIQYYFDSQERDTIDREGRSRRSSEVLLIRDKLLSLPQKEFDHVVKTIKSILAEPSDQKANTSKEKTADAQELYDIAKQDNQSGDLKVSSI